jgi:glycosidase
MGGRSLYQINTRVLLRERGMTLGRPATLDDLPDAFLDDVAARGFDWLWPLGVWQTGKRSREISRSSAVLRAGYSKTLADVRDDDICGSPFAIAAYDVHADFGGDPALARLRERTARRGTKLLLDFVPNHTALDHPWVTTNPAFYVHGDEADLAREPRNYLRVETMHGRRILAHGRDPYFDGWPDTLQLNYRHAGFREAQTAQLQAIADRCDGVRCDMAMLLQPEIFARTWGERSRPPDGSPPRDDPFWPAAITSVRRRHPGFLFVAEVYWDLEWELQQAGFDHTYDKRLYDRLRAGDAPAVHGHLTADAPFQTRSLRFLENHDEPRAAATFSRPVHEAAAVSTYLTQGLHLFHEGQLDGRRVHVSMHLGRRPDEPGDDDLRAFYRRLLAILGRPEVRDGTWCLGWCRPAWEGNPSHEQIIVAGFHLGDRRLMTAVNYGPHRAQGYAGLPLPDVRGRTFDLVDLLSDARYRRTGDDLADGRLYLDLSPYCHHAFEVRPSA